MKMRIVLVVVCLLVLLAAPAIAQTSDDLPETLEGLITSLYAASVRVVGLAAFLMLLYAGILRLFNRAQESNDVIQDAIIGTVLLLSSVLILNSINPDTTRQNASPFSQTEARRNTGGQNAGGAILPIIVQ